MDVDGPTARPRLLLCFHLRDGESDQPQILWLTFYGHFLFASTLLFLVSLSLSLALSLTGSLSAASFQRWDSVATFPGAV